MDTIIRVKAGETWGKVWPILNVDGTVRDITGWTLRGQVRASIGSATVLHTWSTDLGNASCGPAGAAITLAPTDLDDTWTRGVFDLELTAPSGERDRIVEGILYVSRDVTR